MRKFLNYIFCVLTMFLGLKIVNAAPSMYVQFLNERETVERGKSYTIGITGTLAGYESGDVNICGNIQDVRINNTQIPLSGITFSSQDFCVNDKTGSFKGVGLNLTIPDNLPYSGSYVLAVTINFSGSASGSTTINKNLDIPSPIISAGITHTKTNVKKGDIVEWEILVTNQGSAVAKGVSLTATSDSYFDIVGSNVVSVGDITAYSSAKTIKIQGKVKDNVPKNTKLTLRVVVSNLINSPIQPITNDSVIVSEADLVVSNSLVEKDVKPNEDYTYKLTITNKGLVSSSKETVEYEVPSKYTIVKALGATVKGNKLTYEVDSLSPNQSKNYEITIKLVTTNDDDKKDENLPSTGNNNTDKNKPSNSKDEEVKNPQTSSGLSGAFITIICVSVLGLILFVFYHKNKNRLYKL